MKKILLFLITSFALQFGYGQVAFGLKGGINLASIKNEGPGYGKSRIGFNAGALLQLRLQDKILLRPELLYSVKGYRTASTQFLEEATVSLNYINVPVLVGFQPARNLSLLLGPEFGFLNSARSKVGNNTTDVSRIYNDFDIGADLGVAYHFNKNMGLELRYNYGLTNLVNVVYTDPNGNIIEVGNTGANRVLQLGLYFLIP
ncbi:MAG: porin family protein [Flavisolibacter sp.]